MSSLSQRLPHTSRPFRAPASTPRRESIFAGISGAGGNNASTSTSETNPLDVARQASNLLAFREEVVTGPPAPAPIHANRHLPPHQLTAPHLFPSPQTSRPNPRPPLLGPPRSIARTIDPFYQRKQMTSPLQHTLNPLFSHAFVNQMGRIKGRAETGLTWRSQRAVGKMVRRARAMGLISKWSNMASDGGYGHGQGR